MSSKYEILDDKHVKVLLLLQLLLNTVHKYSSEINKCYLTIYFKFFYRKMKHSKEIIKRTSKSCFRVKLELKGFWVEKNGLRAFELGTLGSWDHETLLTLDLGTWELGAFGPLDLFMRKYSGWLLVCTRCPKKKWDLLLVIVAVNPTFFWDTLS